MKDSVIIVTGASDGIGRATVERLAGEGARVVMVARGREKLEAAAAELSSSGAAVESIALDVSDTQAFDALIADVARRHGRLDGLVNNAAYISMGMIADTSEAEWRATFAAGADAVFVGTRAALRIMMPQGSGSIVNIASTNGRRAMPAMGAYSASKAALIHFSRVAAMEAAPTGVRVNALAPGMVLTRGNAAFYDSMPDALLAVSDTIPARRGGQPAEIASAIRFLLSDDATYVNGVCLDVDGGKAAQLYMPA